MYLKRLEINGFKSFAQRTELEFGPGVTAVVGPNGSGKSNIADAVRWVLGEQSARLLRGTKMEDVIFNGSAARSGVSVAEVSLVIDNSRGALPLAFSEVCITRRMDAGGQSEYFINDVPCRRKDIQELFYDTGLGRDTYTLVGQGRVDEILSARSQDRRALLDEAAGIVRYKARKLEARRRLQQVETRLLRLGDIVSELTARLEPLAEQAEQARRHRELSSRLEQAELALRRVEWLQVSSRQAELRRQIESLAEQRRDLERQLEQQRATLVATRTASEQAFQAVEAARRQAEERQQALAALRRQHDVLAERREHLDNRLRQLADELAQLEKQRQEQATLDSDDAERLQALQAAREALEEKRRQCQDRFEEARQRFEQHQAALAQRRDAYYQAMARAGELETAISRGQAQADVLRERLHELDQQIEQLEATLREGEAQLAAAAQAQQEADAAIRGETEELARLAAARRQLEREQAQRSERMHRLQQQLADARSRVQMLQDLQANYEGYFGGVRTALRGRDQGDPAFAGVIGAVAELIRSDAAHEAAIEAALGGAIQNLVVRSADDAQRAIERLRALRGGRATFLPLGSLRVQGTRPSQLAADPKQGYIGWALDLVEYDKQIEEAVAFLLGRVFVTDDLPAARRAAQKTGHALRIVTLLGDVIHPGGAISGGSRVKRQSGLLARDRELAEAQRHVVQLETDQQALLAEHERAQQELVQLDRRRSETEGRLRAAEQRREQAQREMQNLRRALQADQQRLSGLTQQRVQRQEALSETRWQLDAWRQQLGEAQATVRDMETQLRAQEAETPGQTQALNRERDALAEIDAALAANQEQLAALQDLQRRSERERAQFQARLDKLLQEQVQVQAQREASLHEASELERSIAEEEAAVRQAQARLHAAEQSRQQAQQDSKLHEATLEQLRQQLEQLAAQIHQLELKYAEQQVAAEQLNEQVKERFGVELRVDEPDQDATEFAMANMRPSELKQTVRRLRQELEELGPVNPAAESEYVTVRERHRFLQQQTNDLEHARDQLNALLRQIDRQMEEQFRETFQALRERFRAIFQRLFGGGNADLVLDEAGDGPPADVAAGIDAGEDEPEPAGVEILAQPPGKRMQPLSLLSGGERALTAIALLFALLEVKPAPFCVIDEVDAALDDVNVERFSRYLQELSQRMQFIVITHQKRTMAVADTLYGVTLGDDGASRIVAVQMRDVLPAVGS